MNAGNLFANKIGVKTGKCAVPGCGRNAKYRQPKTYLMSCSMVCSQKLREKMMGGVRDKLK